MLEEPYVVNISKDEENFLSVSNLKKAFSIASLWARVES